MNLDRRCTFDAGDVAAVTGKVSSGMPGKTQATVKLLLIGEVPDRGGRPTEGRSSVGAASMPAWAPRTSGLYPPLASPWWSHMSVSNRWLRNCQATHQSCAQGKNLPAEKLAFHSLLCSAAAGKDWRFCSRPFLNMTLAQRCVPAPAWPQLYLPCYLQQFRQ